MAKGFAGLVVVLAVGAFFFFRAAGQNTVEIREDSERLEAISGLERQAEEAAADGQFELAVARLGEAMDCFDKLHARPASVESRAAAIKERRFQLGVKAEVERKNRQQREAAEKERQLAAKQQAEENRRKAEEARQKQEEAAARRRLAEEQRQRAEQERLAAEKNPAVANEIKAAMQKPEIRSRVAAATTQPATFNKYYNLMKNEFMKDGQGSIVLTTEELDDAVAQIRQAAADEKEAIEPEIARLAQQIKLADAQRKQAEEQAREQSKAAREADKRTVYNSWSVQRGADGRIYSSTNRQVDSVAVGQRDAAKRKAQASDERADAHKADVNALRARLGELRKRLAALTSVASPDNRMLPPKPFWTNLGPHMQEMLARVGVTQEEFRGLLKSCGFSEAEFVTSAVVLDAQDSKGEVVIEKLRELFRARMMADHGRGGGR